MAWIRTVRPEEAGPELGAVLERVLTRRGKLSNIMGIQSLHPAAMAAHLDLYLAIMFSRSPLSREERELIAVVVSAANRCTYCVRHHAAALGAYWKDPARLDRFLTDPLHPEGAGIPDRLHPALAYARQLTLEPAAVEESHLATMRDAGFTDEGILAVNLVTAYFNFVNRIAQGLGVELTEEEMGGYRY